VFLNIATATYSTVHIGLLTVDSSPVIVIVSYDILADLCIRHKKASHLEFLAVFSATVSTLNAKF